MAQSISLWGATYNDVPGVELPKSTSGTAYFADPSGTTAVAADVASGKYFLDSSGTLTEGTNSGGGGTFTPVMGVIRPDATLVKSWTYDKRIVQDEGETIPSYSTNTTTFIAGGSYTAENVDVDAYNYLVLVRGLVTPIYNDSTIQIGRQEYWYYENGWERIQVPAGAFTISGKSNSADGVFATLTGGNRYIGWQSTTALRFTSSSNGCYLNTSSITPSFSSNKVTCKYPGLCLKGSTSYFTQAVWDTLTDIRYQYIVELWRVPVAGTDTDGWQNTSMAKHIINCINNGGTLT